VAMYYDILDAAKDIIAALPCFEGWRVTLRKEPSFVPLQDTARQVIIAPRQDISETVRELQFGHAHLGYEVFVILVTLERWDDDELRTRMACREAVRAALWSPAALPTVAAAWDVDYDPAPPVQGLERAAAGQLDVTAQRFTFFTSEARPS